MTTAAVETSVDSWETSYPFAVAWTDNTHVTLNYGQWSYGRTWLVGTTLDAVHDGCTIDSVEITFTALQSVGLCDTHAHLTFYDGGSTIYSELDTAVLTTSSTLYSTGEFGVGMLPSALRAAQLLTYARNDDTFYQSDVNYSAPIITVNYTDRGFPYMLQFSL